ncbi:hypothetical protein ACPV3A_17030 [Paenibacillus sp. Dod16]|uniref:hypothetical protein n=1 Tax=Paenibacillus sp. Dod16 TaxID=3416392 RepID=UPI003CEDED1F
MKNNKVQSQTERKFNVVSTQKALEDDILTSGEPRMSKAAMFVSRSVGVFTLGISVSLFVQLVPFIFLFLAGYIGVPADKSLNNLNSMVWILTSVTVMIVTVYGFITWMKFVWHRLINQPKSFSLFIKRRKKDAE